ncbi:MAG: methylated-DNA--[protein]-cysteine S-methyltransferase [Thermodesulfovibrionales bacterium]|nr:methylated-DNA--[protein]-cysteine S-methyltransferase [Thermodesulfovibrionales bacterium]
MEIMFFKSPIGNLCCFFNEGSLVRLHIGIMELNEFGYRITDDHPFKNELDGYFSGDIREFSQRFSLKDCTGFQKRVLTRALEIPYGHVVTYKDIAVSIGLEKGFQAVGNALGKNPIPIVVPCHRVVGSDGSLRGFSSGIEIKRWLIEHERRFLNMLNL